MREWFLRFSVREQLALLLMAVAVLAWLLFVLALAPLSEARSELARRNEATALVLARVDAMATELRALGDSAGSAGRPDARNITALVNSSAERFGLQPSRLQPNSRGAVQVRFEGAALAALLRWIHDLETSRGLVVEELSLSQTASAGSVSATLRIAAPN